MSPTGVARAVHLSQATVSGILQRLIRHDLIQRRPSPSDGRSVELAVTERGRALLDASPSQLQDRFRDALAGLESWERLQILATLQRVASLMGVDALPASPYLTRGDIDSETPPDPADATFVAGHGPR